jgi:hypothetical protein
MLLSRPATFALLALLTLASVAPAASAPAAETEDEAMQCVKRNLPKKTSVQTVRFQTLDRLGGETVTRAKVLGKLFEDGSRRIVTRFYEPQDVRGSALLVIEKKARNDMFLYSPEFRKTKRVTARAAGNSLFGTDFSYEDFERLQGLQSGSESTRQPDQTLGDLTVYVLETRPTQSDESVYEKIVAFIDPKTCVAVKTESYETGGRLRKVLTADPEKFLQKGDLWLAQEVVMRDIRDETETHLVIEEIVLDEPLSDKRFRQAELERSRD